MFDSDATLGASTTDYSTSEEITNTSGTAYTAGGATLTNAGVSLSSTTAFTDFSDVTYSSATFTANAALTTTQQQTVDQVQQMQFVLLLSVETKLRLTEHSQYNSLQQTLRTLS